VNASPDAVDGRAETNANNHDRGGIRGQWFTKAKNEDGRCVVIVEPQPKFAGLMRELGAIQAKPNRAAGIRRSGLVIANEGGPRDIFHGGW
jgi:hypothetical protein